MKIILGLQVYTMGTKTSMFIAIAASQTWIFSVSHVGFALAPELL